ncbi:MAG: hypothetical protein HOP11_10060 [Saprospiraceae bacterium]|nr:hypothetical protein [Saprospiraceae bacterium]
MKLLLILPLSLTFLGFGKAQIPMDPSGVTLYQKGECKVLVPNVAYKCIFCTDEALTQNCKEYKCSLTSCEVITSLKNSERKSSRTIDIRGYSLKMEERKDTILRKPGSGESTIKKI